MNFKFKSALVALALLAVGSASADQTYSGTINRLLVNSTADNNVSVFLNNTTASCNGAGAIAILRTGIAVSGGAPITDKAYSNMYSVLLAAQLANKTISVMVNDLCSLTRVEILNN